MVYLHIETEIYYNILQIAYILQVCRCMLYNYIFAESTTCVFLPSLWELAAVVGVAIGPNDENVAILQEGLFQTITRANSLDNPKGICYPKQIHNSML